VPDTILGPACSGQNKTETTVKKGWIMKKKLWLIPVICAVLLLGAKDSTSPAMTDDQCAAIEKAVLEKHAQFLQYAQQLDVDKMYDLILENGKGTIIQNSQLLTRQEALDTTKNAFSRLKKVEYKFDQQIVKVLSPEIAIFTGKGQSIATTDTDNSYTTDFAVTSVFVLKNKEWKIIHGHYSSPSM
jgi:hypothetical protein